MRLQDICKLANDGRFEIFRINETGEHLFILKRMTTDDVPCWNVVAKGNSFADMMVFCRDHSTHGAYPLVCSEKFSTFDLIEISNRGFCVLFETQENNQYIVKKFNKELLSWDVQESFVYLQERTAYMNKVLLAPKTIAIE